MIYLFTGTPGSGKSLHAARIITERLKLHKPVIANFEVNPVVKGYQYFYYVDNLSLTPEYLMSFSRGYFGCARPCEDELTVIVDEAQLVFNSRDWSQGDRMAWIKFLSQHRHFGYRVILISQSDRMLDRQIRTLAEYDCQHRKLSNFGLGGALANVLLGGNIFCCVTVYYGLHDKLGAQYFRGGRKYYRVYDSYNLFEKPSEGHTESSAGGFGGCPRAPSVRPSEGGRAVLGRSFVNAVRAYFAKVRSFFDSLSFSPADAVSEVPVVPKAETGVDWDDVF